ncbi:hypothetical protein [Nocardia sp. SC052]|uniref:hypothetical protein n=1 Tax=Nocardia sichangensis TaxID=3385975 RepID=UPI0039A2424C
MATEPASPPHRDRNEMASSLEIPSDHSEESPTAESESPKEESPRAADTTTRSGRYALIAALCAALISSIVSASAAVYVTVNKADRDERLALVQVTLKNRREAYHDLLASAYSFLTLVGSTAGSLRVGNLESFRSGTVEFTNRMVAFLAAADLASMTSSEEIYAMLRKIPPMSEELVEQHYKPFVMKYLATSGSTSDSAEFKRDSAALDTALIDYGNRVSDLMGQFVDQSHKELS